MAANICSPKLENRTARLKLPVAKKPVFLKIDRGIALGYRRNQQGAGTWVVRTMRDGEDWTKAIGPADDYEEAALGRTLTFWTAQARARELAIGVHQTEDASKPATVTEALDSYETDLAARGGNPYNAGYVRTLIPASLAAKTVAVLTAKELRHWRDGLLKRGLAPPSVTRASKSLKAALTLAANHDPRILNTAAWRIGLAALPDSETTRNVVLSERDVCAIVNAAWAIDPELGLFVETAAVTGRVRASSHGSMSATSRRHSVTV